VLTGTRRVLLGAGPFNPTEVRRRLRRRRRHDTRRAAGAGRRHAADAGARDPRAPAGYAASPPPMSPDNEPSRRLMHRNGPVLGDVARR